MPTLSLTPIEQQELNRLSDSVNVSLKRRARLISGYAAGLTTMQAAQQAGISRGRARYWKRQFLSLGMEIFTSPGVQSHLDATSEETSEPAKDSIPESKPHSPLEIADRELEEYPLPAVQKNIGVKSDDSLAEAGRKVWLYHLAILLSHEQGTIKGEDIEELHDMRVAARRMRSAFEVFGEAFSPKEVKKYLKGLRKIGRALGQVRDMDVLLQNAIDYQLTLIPESQAELEPLLEDWRRTISKQRKKLVQHLQGSGYHDFINEFNRFLQQTNSLTFSDDSISGKVFYVRDTLPVLIYSRYAAVRSYDSLIFNATITQLHQLRIEFKKFRYALEYFKEILGQQAGVAINELKGLQDHLGEMHDADVACQLVNKFMQDWQQVQSQQPIHLRVSPEVIMNYMAFLLTRRHQLVSSFPERWTAFNRPEFRSNLAQAISQL